MQPISHYFENFEILVNNVFPIILIVFVLINIGAFIFIWFKRDDFDYDVSTLFGKALWINLLGMLGIFVICSVVFSCVTFFSEEDYNLAGHYYGEYTTQTWLITLVIIASVIVGLVAGYFAGGFSIIGGIVALLAGAATYGIVMYAVGFLIYIVIWLIWLILRFVWLLIGSFGLSLFKFVVTHWLTFILTLAIPACGIGIYCAVTGLIHAWAFEPVHKLVYDNYYTSSNENSSLDDLNDDEDYSSNEDEEFEESNNDQDLDFEDIDVDVDSEDNENDLEEGNKDVDNNNDIDLLNDETNNDYKVDDENIDNLELSNEEEIDNIDFDDNKVESENEVESLEEDNKEEIELHSSASSLINVLNERAKQVEEKNELISKLGNVLNARANQIKEEENEIDDEDDSLSDDLLNDLGVE